MRSPPNLKATTVLLVSPAGPYGQKLIDLGLRWIPVADEAPQRLNPFHELALLVWLWRLVRAEKADVVHSFTIKCAVYGGTRGAAWLARPRVNAVAGMGYVFISDEWLARTLCGRSCGRCCVWRWAASATRLILQNVDDISLFVKTTASGLAAHIRLIPGAREWIAADSYRQQRARAGDRCVSSLLRACSGMQGRARVWSGPRVRLNCRAARCVSSSLEESQTPVTLHRFPNRCCSTGKAAGLVDWLGHVDDMPSLLASADIVVLPSYREGLPKKPDRGRRLCQCARWSRPMRQAAVML